MKQKKLASTLAVAMSFELIVSPVIPFAHADDISVAKDGSVSQTANSTKPIETSKTSKTIDSTAENIGVAMQTISKVWTDVKNATNQQNGMSPQMIGDMQKLKEQMTPQPDKYFNPQKLLQIPGLSNYLALNNINPATLDCKSLPSTLHEARPEVCRVGLTSDRGVPPQAQMSQMFTYYNQYFQVSKVYKNFSTDSNADGQAFGVGCMNNAMNVLNGFFKYRMDELDKLTTNLEAMQDQFKKASRSDLDAIEEATAVLDGESDLADKVRSKKPDLFDFAKRFNNPACNSMFAGNVLNDTGRESGLNGINRNLKETLTTKNGKYSGESYSQSHTAVVEDLNSLADKVSKQLELNFAVLSQSPDSYGQFLSSLPSQVSSTSGANNALSPDLFSEVRTKFNDSFMKLSDQKATVQSELAAAGIPSKDATDLFGNSVSTNFESEVARIENRLKNKCFESTLSDINRDKMMDKIYDPSSSGHANKYASNFLKDKLNKILDNKETSLDKKLQELQSLEAQNGGRYFMKMENSYEVQELDANGNLKTRIVGASSKRTPSVFFTDLIKNCEAQFKANKLDNKMSGASAIQKLRQLNQDYKNLAKTQASDMRQEVRKKLIECTSPEEANNTIPGSCTPERFNTAAPGFCANAAFTCSQNMQACSKQAETYIKEIKDQRTARVNNYKSLVEKNKLDVVKMFDSALSRYMKDGEMLRGLFGAGFSSPSGIKREVEGDQKYIGDILRATGKSTDGRLLLEDPEAYTEMFKANIALLKESVRKQQDQILGGDATGMGSRTPGLLAQHIKQTEKNYKEVIRDSDRISEECKAKHDGAIAAGEQQRGKEAEEQKKKMTDLGEKQREFCKRFSQAANGNPGPACSGNISDIFKVLGNEQSTAASSIALENHCNAIQNEGSNKEQNAYSICLNAKVTFPEKDPVIRVKHQEMEEAKNKMNEAYTAYQKVKDDKDKNVTDKETAKKEYSSLQTSYTDALSKYHTALEESLNKIEDPQKRALTESCIALHECLSSGDKTKNCNEAKNKSIALQILDVSGKIPPVTLDSTPAFCVAADNSTNRFAKAVETIGGAASNAVRQPAGATAK